MYEETRELLRTYTVALTSCYLQEGPYHETAAKLYTDLRENLVVNIFTVRNRTVGWQSRGVRTDCSSALPRDWVHLGAI